MEIIEPSRNAESERQVDTETKRRTFARNVRSLIDVLGVPDKQAAKLVGVPYKWLWRMATVGISRIDDRNLTILRQFADHFALGSTEVLWREGLLYWLIVSDQGRPFVERFRDELAAFNRREEEKFQATDIRLIEAVRQNPWIVFTPREDREAPSVSVLSREQKLDALVATGSHDALKQMADALGRMIDEAYDREVIANQRKQAATA